jgi:hypothetical protein
MLDTLSRLKQAGHAVTILMVGDNPVASRLAGIPIYPLGGEETWKEFLACYNQPEDVNATGQPQTKEVEPAGFRL